MISWIKDICSINPVSLSSLISSAECCQILGLDKLAVTITIYTRTHCLVFLVASYMPTTSITKGARTSISVSDFFFFFCFDSTLTDSLHCKLFLFVYFLIWSCLKIYSLTLNTCLLLLFLVATLPCYNVHRAYLITYCGVVLPTVYTITNVPPHN